MSTRRILVTGTDTGVGKTVASAAIVACWTGAGRPVTYVKPAQSGTDDGDDDAAFVAAHTGAPTIVGPRLGEALAPAVAARRAGQSVTLDDLLATVAAAPADADLVVEGAGGLLVELGTDGTMVVDLAAAADLPIVVVARPGLGTLNHTLLTLAEADRRGLAVVGVVVSGFPAAPDLATRTNLAELRRLTDGRLVGIIPDLGANPAPHAETLAAAPAWFTSDLAGTADPATW